jgi:RimJ/RimL family protein N-acetyltransferase
MEATETRDRWFTKSLVTDGAGSDTVTMRSPYWPLFELRVTTPRLEMRPPSDDDLAALAAVAADGVHEPGYMPFSIPWTEGGPEAAARNTLQFNWRLRAEWKPEDWHLTLVTLVDGEVVGNQGIGATSFAITKTVETGSWVGLRHQGQGIGKEMRAAVLHFAFDGLGAEVALSGAWADNARSLGVSAAMGYEPNGERIGVRQGEGDRLVHLRLPRQTWEARRRDDICIEGLDACRAEFGLTV